MCCPATSNYPQQPTTEAAPPPSTNVTWTRTNVIKKYQCSAFSRSPTFCRGCREQKFKSRCELSLHQRRCQPFQFILKAIIASPSALLPSNKSRNQSNDSTKQEIVVSNTNSIIKVILFINQCQFLILSIIHHRQLSSAEVS